jgi:sugar fermentation stimulation protein A
MKSSTHWRLNWRGHASAFRSGTYQLVILLARPKVVSVGALGEVNFPTGSYIYTGRASRNLVARVERHLRTEKAIRWHIDYLLQWAEVTDVRIFPGRAEDECTINLETAEYHGYSFPVRGFGSSDCRCLSHLAWAGKTTDKA